jgi:RNA polymerase sigma factor (sigma-70 family)
MQELDDNALLHEYVQRKSEAAFTALVTRHVNKVYSVALRHTGNPHQAEEITQAVFVILARKANRLGENAILEGWLYQTARLTALTFVRSEIRGTRREQEVYMQTDVNGSAPDVWAPMAPLVDAAMGKLNENDRHAVVLRFFYGKSLKEVGAALGGSEGAARVRLHRAVEKLRVFFLKRGIASTTATIEGAISVYSRLGQDHFSGISCQGRDGDNLNSNPGKRSNEAHGMDQSKIRGDDRRDDSPGNGRQRGTG